MHGCPQCLSGLGEVGAASMTRAFHSEQQRALKEERSPGATLSLSLSPSSLSDLPFHFLKSARGLHFL